MEWLLLSLSFIDWLLMSVVSDSSLLISRPSLKISP